MTNAMVKKEGILEQIRSLSAKLSEEAVSLLELTEHKRSEIVGAEVETAKQPTSNPNTLMDVILNNMDRARDCIREVEIFIQSL